MSNGFLSKRVKKRDQIGITSDRYEFLGLDQAEPDLGDPLVGPSSIGVNPAPVGQPYVLVAIQGQTGKRYWTPPQGLSGLGLIPGSFTIRDEGVTVGLAQSFTTLNFVGDGISVDAVGSGIDDQTGIATVRVVHIGYGNTNEIQYVNSAGLQTGATGIVYANGNVGFGSITPTVKLDLVGDVLVSGGGTFSYITVQNISANNSISIGSTQIVSNTRQLRNILSIDETTRLTIESALQLEPNNFNSLNVSGVGTFGGKVDLNGGAEIDGQTTVENLNVTGIATVATARLNAGTATLSTANIVNSNVSGVSTLANVIISSGLATFTSAVSTNLNVSGIATIVEAKITNSNISGFSTISSLLVTGNADVSGNFSVDNNTLYVDSNNNRVGIGTSNAQYTLDVLGNVNIDGTLYVDGSSGLAGQVLTSSGLGTPFWGNLGDVTAGAANSITIGDSDFNAIVYPILSPVTTGVSTVSVDSDGLAYNPFTNRLGIGSAIPSVELDVSGDVNVTKTVTAKNFVGDLSAGIATITTLNTGDITVQFAQGTNLNYTGVGTIATLRATNSTLTNLISTDATVTDIDGTNLNYTGVGTIATLKSTNSTLTNLTSTDATITDIDGTNLNYSGVGTVTTLASTNATITNLTSTDATITDIDGTNLNYSGVGTIATLRSTSATLTNLISTDATVTDIDGTNLNYTGVGTIATLYTGSITGPAEIVIDPTTIGDNSGSVRIKGDLFVDGTQTIVNSTTVELADFNVGIATTVGTNILLDGAGIGIGATGIRKTLSWNNNSTSLKSSENFDLNSGKSYKINGTEILSSSHLNVPNINISGISTLANVRIATGIATFNYLDVVNLNISGTASITSGIASITTAYIGIGTIADFTTTNLNVVGITTTRNLNVGTGGTVLSTTSRGYVGINSTSARAELDIRGNAVVSGVITATKFVGNVEVPTVTATNFSADTAYIGITTTLRLEVGIGGTALTVNQSGFVGINTRFPQSRLSVGGTISEIVNGVYYDVLTTQDIGLGTSQVPSNNELGALAYLDEYLPPQFASGIVTTSNFNTVTVDSFATNATRSSKYLIQVSCKGQFQPGSGSVSNLVPGSFYMPGTYTGVGLTGGSGYDALATITVNGTTATVVNTTTFNVFTTSSPHGIGNSQPVRFALDIFKAAYVGIVSSDVFYTRAPHGIGSSVAVSFASSVTNPLGIAITAGQTYYATGTGSTTFTVQYSVGGNRVINMSDTTFTGLGNTATLAGLAITANNIVYATGIGLTTFSVSYVSGGSSIVAVGVTQLSNTVSISGGVSSVAITTTGSGYRQGQVLTVNTNNIGTVGSGFSFTTGPLVDDFQVSDILVLQTVGSASTNVEVIEYVTLANNINLGEVTADINSGNVRVRFAPTYKKFNEIRVTRTSLDV
jgi:hypothetical protein